MWIGRLFVGGEIGWSGFGIDRRTTAAGDLFIAMSLGLATVGFGWAAR